MAILSLESEHPGTNWPALEKMLERVFPGSECVSIDKDKRTYRLNVPDQNHQISLLQKLQSLFAEEDIHFFIDLSP